MGGCCMRVWVDDGGVRLGGCGVEEGVDGERE